MEALGDLHYYASRMAEAQNEQESDQFLGALLPVIGQVAAPLLSSLLGGQRESGDFFDEEDWGSQESRDEFLPALLPMALPLITKGIGAIGKLLGKRRNTRRFAAAMPRIASGAATRIAQAAGSGRPLTPQRIAAAVSQETAQVLSNPRYMKRTIQQNRSYARRATSGVPPMSSSIGTRTNGYGYGARTTPQARGRMTNGGARRRPRVIGYVPVYGKR
jgi:hypothetical protein